MASKDDAFFNECLAKLVQYRKEQGHFDVPNGYIDPSGRRLGAWLYRVRKSYETGKLRQDRFDRLLQIGYDVRNVPIATATPKKVPPAPKPTPKPTLPSTPATTAKVAVATAAPTTTATSTAKKTKKEDDSKYRPKVDTWDKNFDRLVKFKAEQGHLNPDFATHKALRTWLNKQRDLWFYGDLDDDRIERLRALGVPEPDPSTDGSDHVVHLANLYDVSGESHVQDEDGKARFYHFAGGRPGDEFAVWGEPGISTRSAKKKRKMEAEEFSDLDDVVVPRSKRAAMTTTKTAGAAAEPPGDEAPPSFLSCVYQAVSERVSSFFFPKPAA